MGRKQFRSSNDCEDLVSTDSWYPLADRCWSSSVATSGGKAKPQCEWQESSIFNCSWCPGCRTISRDKRCRFVLGNVNPTSEPWPVTNLCFHPLNFQNNSPNIVQPRNHLHIIMEGSPTQQTEQLFDQKPSFLLHKRKNIWLEDAEILRNKKPSPVRPQLVSNDSAALLESVCGLCGSTFASIEELDSHISECRTKQQKLNSHVAMVPLSLVDQADCLPDFWRLVLQSLDIYIVPADDLPLPRRGRTPVVEGSVGIRCTHCAAQNVMGSGSMYFPGSISLLSTIIYKISDSHLMNACPYTPKSIQAHIRKAKPHTHAQTAMEDRIALPTYLREVTDLFQLVDAPGGKGIRRSEDVDE